MQIFDMLYFNATFFAFQCLVTKIFTFQNLFLFVFSCVLFLLQVLFLLFVGLKLQTKDQVLPNSNRLVLGRCQEKRFTNCKPFLNCLLACGIMFCSCYVCQLLRGIFEYFFLRYTLFECR